MFLLKKKNTHLRHEPGIIVSQQDFVFVFNVFIVNVAAKGSLVNQLIENSIK